MAFRKIYTRDKGAFFTPVYFPGETYSFYINSDTALTQSNQSDFRLDLYDANGDIAVNTANQVVGEGIGDLQYIGFNEGVLSTLAYQIHCTFVFPDVKFGHYYMAIMDTAGTGEPIEKARTNYILCEWENIEFTSYVKYRDTYDRSGFRYEALPEFYNRVRLPLHQVNMVFESDRTQYRNVSTTQGRSLAIRNLKSNLDEVVTLECREMDDAAARAMAEVLEHDEVYIDGYRILNKSQLAMAEQSTSELRLGTFEIYTNQYSRDPEHFNEYGDVVIYNGEGILNPNIIFSSQF